jgi:hypothetical protein
LLGLSGATGVAVGDSVAVVDSAAAADVVDDNDCVVEIVEDEFVVELDVDDAIDDADDVEDVEDTVELRLGIARI